MKKVSRCIKDILAVVLTAIFLIELVPPAAVVSGAAAQAGASLADNFIVPSFDGAESLCENVAIEYEATSQRDAYTKVYRLSDGTYYSLTSSVPVHRTVGGAWVDIVPQSLQPPQDTDRAQSAFSEQLSRTLEARRAALTAPIRAGANAAVVQESESPMISAVALGTYTDIQGSVTENTDKICGYNALWILTQPSGGCTGERETATVYAQVSLEYVGAAAGTVLAQEVLSAWGTQGLSLNPAVGSQIQLSGSHLDYAGVAVGGGSAYWVITDLALKWERGICENNGILLRAFDACSLTAASEGGSLAVTVTRRYKIIDRLDSEYTYHSFDIGRAGTAYINDCTGTLLLSRDELGLDGNRMPVSIQSFICAQSSPDTHNCGGVGRMWNYLLPPIVATPTDSVCTWVDLDGHTVEFTRVSPEISDSSGRITWLSEESGYVLRAREADSVGNSIIESPDETVYLFDSDGMLESIEDAYGNTTELEYESGAAYGRRIKSVTDGAGRNYRFSYSAVDGAGELLTEIEAYASSSEQALPIEIGGEPVAIQYGYTRVGTSSEALLTSAAYADDETVYYRYDSYGRLAEIEDIDGTLLTIEYLSPSGRVVESCVKTRTLNGQTAVLDSLTIEYTDVYRHRVVDLVGNYECFEYDRCHRMIFHDDGGSGGKYYMDYSATEPETLRHIIYPATHTNLVRNGDFEQTRPDGGLVDWGIDANGSVGSAVDDDNTCAYLSINVGSDGCIYQPVPMGASGAAGTTVVLTARGKSSGAVQHSEHLWGILLTFYDLSGQLITEGVDPFFILPFTNSLDGEWHSAMAAYTLPCDVGLVGVVLGVTEQAGTLYFDDIHLYAANPEDIVVCSEATAADEEPCVCGEDCHYGGGCPCECASAAVCECEECAAPPRCVCADDCDYGDRCPCECASAGDCSCVVCRASRTTDRDEYGNITSSSVSDGTRAMTSSTYYTANGDRERETVDENGNSVYYNYNSQNGLLDNFSVGADNQSVSGYDDGEGISFGYNPMGLLTSISQAVSGLTDSQTEMTNTYAYTDDRLTSITHNGFSYNYEYDIYGNPSVVKVGSQPLVSYTYGSEPAARDRLNSVTYGNGDTVYYDYDTDGNIVHISFDGITPSYIYEYADAEVSAYIDIESGTKTICSEDGFSLYSYNAAAQTLGSLLYSSETADGVETSNIAWFTMTASATDYTENPVDGKTTAIDRDSGMGKALQTDTVTDWFGRNESRASVQRNASGATESALTTAYAYNDTASTVGRQLTNYSSTYSWLGTDLLTHEYSYEYDDRGNLVEIRNPSTDALLEKYVYDEAGQLIRNDSGTLDRSFTYSYDSGGNITSKKEYVYTTGALASAIDTFDYEYADAAWRDKVTSYDGKPITYDAIGNITAFDGNTYSWNGRRLEGMTTSDNRRILFDYNDAGLRTRRLIFRGSSSVPVEDRYIWNGDVLEAIIQMDGAGFSQLLKFIYADDGEALGFYFRLGTQGQSSGFFGEGVIWYVKNGRGDVIALMGDNELLGEYRYDAWGNMSFAPMPGLGFGKLIVVLLVSVANPYSYRGYYNDYSVGMHYLQSRFYHPELGRFLNADDPEIPKSHQKDINGANLFAYCLNNPVRYTDPTGKFSKSKFIVDIFTTKQFAIPNAQLKLNMKLALPFGKSTVAVHKVTSATDFLDKWKKITFCDIAVILGHGNPTQTIKQLGVASINNLTDDTNRKHISCLIILSCNAAHQERATTNIASAFSKQIYGTVVASDGDVEFPMFSVGQIKFKSVAGDGWVEAGGDEKKGNTGWCLYNYADKKVTCEPGALGKTITMKSVMNYFLS